MSIRRSRFRGVVPTGDPARPWAARIQGDGRAELVPCATEEQAARAYDRHWMVRGGLAFRFFNFPEDARRYREKKRKHRPIGDELRAEVVAVLVAMEADGVKPTIPAMQARVPGRCAVTLSKIRAWAVEAGLIAYRANLREGLMGRDAREKAEIDAAIEAARAAKAEAWAKVERFLPLAIRPCRFLGNHDHYLGRSDR